MEPVVILEARVHTHVQDAKPKHAPEKLILEHQDLALIVISVRKYFVATKRCEAYEKIAGFFIRLSIYLYYLIQSMKLVKLNV